MTIRNTIYSYKSGGPGDVDVAPRWSLPQTAPALSALQAAGVNPVAHGISELSNLILILSQDCKTCEDERNEKKRKVERMKE